MESNKQYERIKTEWLRAFKEMSHTEGFSRLIEGQINVNHYKAILREVYFYARENSQIQSSLVMHLRGKERSLVRNLLSHAESEVGRDEMVLNDLKYLKEDVSRLPFERPLPSTAALIGFSFYQAHYCTPLAYLGCLFHNDSMLSHAGHKYTEQLLNLKIPSEALSFISSQAGMNGNGQRMEKYIEVLGSSEDVIEEMIYAARVVASLWGRMVTEAVQSVDEPKGHWGINAQEVRATFGKKSQSFLDQFRFESLMSEPTTRIVMDK